MWRSCEELLSYKQHGASALPVQERPHKTMQDRQKHAAKKRPRRGTWGGLPRRRTASLSLSSVKTVEVGYGRSCGYRANQMAYVPRKITDRSAWQEAYQQCGTSLRQLCPVQHQQQPSTQRSPRRHIRSPGGRGQEGGGLVVAPRQTRRECKRVVLLRQPKPVL